MEWFTVEKIDKKTYCISEYFHWEQVHSYLLLGSNKALLIDTGLGVANIKKVIQKITKLPIIVTTTHVHWDHIGGHSYFDNIYVSREEQGWLINFPLPLNMVKKNLMLKPCNFPKSFLEKEYKLPIIKNSKILEDGAIIDLGDRQIQVVHTPGHSPGHMCYYEQDKKYLYTGDLIYNGKLDMFYPTTDSKLFQNSIKNLLNFEVSKILPGHYNLNVDVSIISKINEAFKLLESENKINVPGIYQFDDFSIHI